MEGKNLIRFFFLFCALCILSLFSCKNSGEGSGISEDELVAVLVDMHIADATLLHLTGKAQFSPDKANPYYDKVIEKHNMTRVQFETELKNYADNPEKLDKLYNKVIENLTRLEDGLMGKDSATVSGKM